MFSMKNMYLWYFTSKNIYIVVVIIKTYNEIKKKFTFPLFLGYTKNRYNLHIRIRFVLNQFCNVICMYIPDLHLSWLFNLVAGEFMNVEIWISMALYIMDIMERALSFPMMDSWIHESNDIYLQKISKLIIIQFIYRNRSFVFNIQWSASFLQIIDTFDRKMNLISHTEIEN